MRHFGEGEDGAVHVFRAPQLPTAQIKVAFRFRQVSINRYDANDIPFVTNPAHPTKQEKTQPPTQTRLFTYQTNEFQTQAPIDVATDKALLKGPTQRRNALSEKLRPFIRGQHIDGSWGMWGMRQTPHTDDEAPLILTENRAQKTQGTATGQNYVAPQLQQPRVNQIIPPPPPTNQIIPHPHSPNPPKSIKEKEPEFRPPHISCALKPQRPMDDTRRKTEDRVGEKQNIENDGIS